VYIERTACERLRSFLRTAALVLALILPLTSGCTRNTFGVNDPTGSVTSAELRLCGSRVKLLQSGHRFSATQFSCAGDGYVAVRLADGRETACRIGYVTSGAEQHLEFDIADARCTVKASQSTIKIP
jgi:hypothetical protein